MGIYAPAIFPQSLEIVGHSNNFEQIFEQYQQKAYELMEKYDYFYSEVIEEKYLPVLDENNKKTIGKDNFFISWFPSQELDINILSLGNNEAKKAMYFYFRNEPFDKFANCTKNGIDNSLKQTYLLWGHKNRALFTINVIDSVIGKHSKEIEINPNDYEALWKRGIAYCDKGELDLALADYTSALKIKPNFAEALSSRGIVYYFKNEYDKAIADYTAALKINPKYDEALFNRAITWHYKGEWDKAIADYTALLKINPKDHDTLTKRGMAYIEKGDYNRSIADYTAALKIKPDYDQAYLNRGLAYMSRNIYDKAIQDLDTALRISPNNPDIQKYLDDARQKYNR
jgi:tetratricopeptide (TPR) repeat protein